MNDFIIISIGLFFFASLTSLAWFSLYSSPVRMSLWKFNRMRETKYWTIASAILALGFLLFGLKGN